jgi:hypothetical protein
MQYLCSLPLLLTDNRAIGQSLLSDWLTARSVGKLDSALCYRSHREKFLHLLASTDVHQVSGRYNRDHIRQQISFFDWAINRSAKFHEVWIENRDVRHIEKYLQVMGGAVRRLMFVYPGLDFEFAEKALMVAEYCHNLIDLEIGGPIMTSALAVLVTVNPSLLSLRSFGQQLDEVILTATKRFCRGLQILETRAQLNVENGLHHVSAMAALRVLRLPEVCGADNCLPLLTIATNCLQLEEVRLNFIQRQTLSEFADRCPNIQVFEASLCESVTASVLGSITTRWTQLRTLILLQEEGAIDWSYAMQSALLRLIQRCHTLTTLVCMETLSWEKIGTSEELCGLLSRPVVNEGIASLFTSQLQRLWLQALTREALQTVLAICPLLTEVIHLESLPPQCFTLLSAPRLKSVGLSCAGCKAPALASLVALSQLRLWDIGEGLDDALVDLCSRSPALQTLSLHFAKRPDLSVISRMLRHVPSLTLCSICALVEGDEDGDWNLTTNTRKLVREVCPKVAFGYFNL